MENSRVYSTTSADEGEFKCGSSGRNTPVMEKIQEKIIEMDKIIKQIEQPKKSKKRRCQVCRKKLGLSGFKCKCSDTNFFCSKHRYAEEHNCSFDYKKENKDLLREKNPQIVSDKIIRI